MKTISRYIMTLALLITAVGGAWAQTQWESGDCTVTLNNGTLTVSGNGAMDEYADPSDRPWHDNMGDITSVVVESGVTSVGMAAFFYCTAMTSVTLPEGLTAIGPNAFFSCSSLTSVTIPSTVTSIGQGAFRGCSAMTSVTLPEGLTAIGGSAFASCSSLQSITIPSTVTSIGQGAFGSCSAISDVNLYANPDNLTWSIDTHFASDDFKEGKATQCHVLAEYLTAYQTKFNGQVNVTFVGDLKPLATSDDVTINDDKTEAKFTMPPFDATVNYELVRDMQDEANPVAFSGLPTNDEPIVVKKGSDGKYQPAEALTIQLIDPLAAAETQNIIAADGITIKVEKKGDGDNWTSGTFADFLADMQPGTYRLTATPKDENSPYDGTVYSSQFTVVEQYDLLVKPANDFSKGKVESVTVGSESVTIDANTGKATKTGIAPDTEVKVKAKRGYVIEKVEAKKGIAPPDPVTVTWNSPSFSSNPYTRDGVTLTTTGNAASGNNFNNGGDKTFTNTIGKFTKIEIVCEANNFDGWAKESAGGYQVPEGPYIEVFKLTWTGNAESVTIPGGNYLYGISSITFTIQ